MKHIKPIVLVILDGWGYSTKKKYNAIYQAHPANFNARWQQYPHAILRASGTAVGLPPHMMGNSAVGHLTIGAGRIIEQPITYFLRSIEDKTFFAHKKLQHNFKKLAQTGKALHLIGLLSDGGVHGHEKIIHALLQLAAQCSVKKVYIHAILDGRDTPPMSAARYLKKLETICNKTKIGSIASLHGRFYAMDRDGNWSRVMKSFEVITKHRARILRQAHDTLTHSYAHGITDEFIEPILLDPNGYIQDGDGVIFTNIRADRSRELPALLLNQQHMHLKFAENELPSNEPIPPKHKLPRYAFFMTATEYHPELKVEILYQPKPIKHTFFDIVSAAKKTIFTIAESEKYAHVTYFFNGGKDIIRPNETRIIIPSRPDKNFAEHPAMSAPAITKAVLHSLKTNPHDVYLINYANADMVGHTGNFAATIKAIKVLDKELKKLYDIVVEKMNGTLFITADHGNAEDKWDSFTQSIRTSHTTNPVPFLMIQKGQPSCELPLKELSDIAPFIVEKIFTPKAQISQTLRRARSR